MTKIVIELNCEPDGLFCGECKFLEENFCNLLRAWLQEHSDGYEITDFYRNHYCIEAEEKAKGEQ